jgi:hypothetical protein
MSEMASGIEAPSSPASQPATVGQPEAGVWIFVPEADREEVEALLASIDARLAEANQRADRMLASMGLS